MGRASGARNKSRSRPVRARASPRGAGPRPGGSEHRPAGPAIQPRAPAKEPLGPPLPGSTRRQKGRAVMWAELLLCFSNVLFSQKFNKVRCQKHTKKFSGAKLKCYLAGVLPTIGAHAASLCPRWGGASRGSFELEFETARAKQSHKAKFTWSQQTQGQGSLGPNSNIWT